MTTLLRAGLVVSAVACAELLGAASSVAAAAAPGDVAARLAIAPVKGDVAGAIGAQLERALCGEGACLPGALAGPRLDLARARRLGAAGSLVASVWREKGGRVLSAALFTATTAPVRTWKLPLGRDGRLAQDGLDELARDVARLLWPPAPSASPPVAAGPSPSAPVPAPALAVAPAPAPAAPEVAAPRPMAVAAAPPAPTRRAPRLLVEAGLAPNHRELRYEDTGAGTAPLGVVSDQPAMPRLRVEVRLVESAGAALYADVAFGNGIELTTATRTHRATATRLEAGALWRLPLTRSLAVVPALAVQRETFEVGRSGGVPLAAFADQRLLGLRGGAGLELWLERTRFTVLAGLAGTWWQEAGELAGSADFFPGGRAWSLAAEAGLAIDLWGPVSARVLGDYAVTRWSLDPGATYTSSWARQEVVGGRFMLRAGF